MKPGSRLKPWKGASLSILLLLSLWLPAFSSAAQQGENVSEDAQLQGQTLVYDFLDAFSGTGDIRVVGNPTVPPITVRNNSYGAGIDMRSIGLTRSFELTVPESGYYLISFQGYLYFSAGIGELSVNGVPIGTYDFYDPRSVMGPATPMKTMYLNAGDHELSFKSVGRNPSATAGNNYSLYASKLFLEPVEGLPVVQVTAELSKPLLLPNENASIDADVSLSDQTEPSNPVFSYSSSDPSVATVSTAGVITAVAPGTADIVTSVATDEGNGSTVRQVVVTTGFIDSVELSLNPDVLYPGAEASVTLNGTLDDNTEVSLRGIETVYSVDNPTVASISPNGVLTALQPGQTVVRAEVSFNNQTTEGSLQFEVTPLQLAQLDLIAEPASVTVSQYGQMQVSGRYQDGSDADLSQAEVEWQSLTPAVLHVDQDTGSYRGLQIGVGELQATVQLDSATVTDSVYIEVTELTSDKTRSTYYTIDKVTNARNNSAAYPWAASIRDAAVTAADQYLALGHEFWWNIVTSQNVPRSYGVNQVMGSPVTGRDIDEYGNYPYTADPVNAPWKIVDPSSGYVFPTNDFGAYYESGLDEHGLFQPELADRSLLVNTLYPERGPDWGVDDGYGWVDDEGNTYTFIAYYNHWNLWHSTGLIPRAVTAFKDAYIYTGDVKYARAGLILLDRIADVYPDLDTSAFDPTIFLHSAGGTGAGKAVGSIWETATIKVFVSAYDAFFPASNDQGVIDFLSVKGEDYQLSWKDSSEGVRRNIEDGIIRQVYPGVRQAQIRGNVGMHQSALAMAAVVLDTLPETQQWLDFNNQSGSLVANPWRVTGGNMLTALVDTVDRDGHGNESAPGYNVLWLNNFIQVADVLYGYDLYPTADLYENVKFRSMFAAMYPLLLSEKYIPSIGDSEKTGNPNLGGLNLSQMVKAFQIYGDPIYAQVAYFLNGDSSEGIHGDIFTENPEAIAADLDAVIQTEGPLQLDSVNLTGYGFAALRDGVNDRSNYGINYLFPQLNVTQASTAYNTYPSSGTVQLEAETAGHSITFEFDVDEADTYYVMLKPFRAGSYGIYNVYINNQLVKEIDFFGTMKDEELLEEMPLAAGTHTIRFENIGRTPGATNFKMGVTSLRLLTEDEYELALEQQNTLRDVWMYYGRTSGHGHRDALNLGLHAFDLDLAPDLGYPEFADSVDMHRAQWVNNTISHNTVVVNKRKQNVQFVSKPTRFDETERVKLVEVEAPIVYPQLDIYRRATAMIQVDDENSYSVDFFRVKGGTDHHFSFHSAEGTVTTEGLALTSQPTGTYAGPNVEFGERVDDVHGPNYMGSGFHWLKNVERGTSASDQFSVDWNVRDTWNVLGQGARAATDIHLRLTMLGAVDEVALADGVPPQNKAGNPPELRYLIAHRTGTNLDSLFTSVIEPYRENRYIADISEAEVKRNGVAVDTSTDMTVRAVKVELVDGRTDYILYSADPSIEYVIDDKIEFKGLFGVYSERNSATEYMYLQDGSKINRIGETPLTSTTAVTGEVVDFTKELSMENEIEVELVLNGVNPQELVGRMIYVENDGVRNAVYTIEDLELISGDLYRVDIGNKTTVRRFVNANDFSQGYVYDLQEGASVRIPLSVEVEF